MCTTLWKNGKYYACEQIDEFCGYGTPCSNDPTYDNTPNIVSGKCNMNDRTEYKDGGCTGKIKTPSQIQKCTKRYGKYDNTYYSCKLNGDTCVNGDPCSYN